MEDARKRPGELTFASSGPYGASHLPLEMFLQSAGLKMRHLPTTGGAPATSAVPGGHAQLWASPPALAISKLIFGGVLERLPDLRIAFAHGGGAFPFTLARLNHGWHVRPEGPAAIPKEPRGYARRIYVDSLALSPRNLRFIVEKLAADRVMIGSDYPFDMGDADPVGSLASAGLDPDARRLIEGYTAARFLRLPGS